MKNEEYLESKIDLMIDNKIKESKLMKKALENSKNRYEYNLKSAKGVEICKKSQKIKENPSRIE